MININRMKVKHCIALIPFSVEYQPGAFGHIRTRSPLLFEETISNSSGSVKAFSSEV